MQPEPQYAIRWSDQSDWFDMPKQQRSRATMQRIFDAAIHLFSSRGFEATTTDDIAKDAGVTKGSIYRRFPDKEGILYTIIEAYGHSRVPEVEKLVDPLKWRRSSAAAVLDFYVGVVVSAYRQDARVIRIIERRALVDPKAAELINGMNASLLNSIVSLLELYVDEIKATDIRRAMTQTHTIIRGTLVHLILADDCIPSRFIALDDPGLETMMCAIARSFVGLRNE